MNEHRIKDKSYARELAISAKEHDRLERENKLMKMLMEIGPPHRVTSRYVSEDGATGYLNADNQYLFLTIEPSGHTVIMDWRHIYEPHLFSGIYPQAQAWLAERLK